MRIDRKWVVSIHENRPSDLWAAKSSIVLRATELATPCMALLVRATAIEEDLEDRMRKI